ncbi:MAG: hypothetical protein SVR08_02905 [Spirochaetota bacterium]|nr:hypothetical protein [Spirochaetota bacterium]
MKYKDLSISVYLFLILFIYSSLYAKTDISINLMSGYNFINEEQTENNFENFPNRFFSKNREIIPTGFAIVNTLGYPNGISKIRRFPHLEFGIAAGGGLLEYTRKDDYKDDNPVIPFGGFNGGLHIGTGINNKFDITFKLFFFSLDWISSLAAEHEGYGETTYYKIEIDESYAMSVGFKLRYNMFNRLIIRPMFFNFGGVSLNLGFDYMKGSIDSLFTFSDRQNVDLDVGTIDVVSYASGEGSLEWNILSITPEALVYFDLFSVISLYTGPSVSLNFGYVNFDFEATGNFIAQTGSPVEGDIGDVELKSTNYLVADIIIPKWIVGIEIDIYSVKLQLEGSTILTSMNDSFTAQIGIRTQF